MNNFHEKVDLIWSLANLLRGDYKPHEYADVILPLVVLRRLDLAMAPTRASVRQAHEKFSGRLENLYLVLSKAAGGSLVYNYSEFDWQRLLDAPSDLAQNLVAYFNGFSPDVLDIIEKFEFRRQVSRLQGANLLYPILRAFQNVDLHPDRVKNHQMGYIFEELIRKFSEQYNETAGEHFTPREVIALMVDLLLSERADAFIQPGKIVEIFDPACGTGGMLTEGSKAIEERSADLHPEPQVYLFGQEINPTSYAVAKADLLLKGEDPRRLVFGNSFSEDGHAGKRFRLMLSNPPFGVEWKKVEYIIRNEHEAKGDDGRFAAGLPRITDGSFLFLQHMLAKRFEDETGSRIAIIFNGSPLFTGDAGSGESEIRRWIIENDWLEAIVALPEQLFYNTGISTYVWILTNDKADADRGRVRLIDARESGTKMRKSLGDKRKELTSAAIDEIAQLYGGAMGEFADNPRVKVLPNEVFGFQRITVERPLRRRWEVTPDTLAALESSKAWIAWKDAPTTDVFAPLLGTHFASPAALTAAIKKLDAAAPLAVVRELIKLAAVADPEAPVIKGKAGAEPDPDLRDAENIPLPEGWLSLNDKERAKTLVEAAQAHLEAEIHPYVPDAWIDHTKTRVGFEIPFTRQFYVYTPPRPVAQIAAEIKDLETQIQGWMKGLGL